MGNLVRKTAKAAGETWRYDYTIFDELKRATRHVSVDVASPAIFAKSYQYDALGRLRSDTVEDLTAATTGDATVYHYDGQNIVRTYVVPGNAATNEIRDARFYTGSNNTDELLGLALVDETQSASVRPWAWDPQQGVGYYAHTDHQGSIRAITDDTGAVVNQYTYGAYGNTETAVEAIPQRFRYTGREWDRDIALMHYRARVYDPDSGRFLQEDPIGLVAMHPNKSDVLFDEFPTDKVEQGFAVAFASEHNLYRYLSNNSLNYVDPDGTFGKGVYLNTIRVAKSAVRLVKKGNELGTDTIRRIYVKLITMPKMSSKKVNDAIGCTEYFIRGLKGGKGTPSVTKTDIKYICQGAGMLVKYGGQLIGKKFGS